MADTVTFRDRTYGAGDLLTALISFASMQDSAGATDFLVALPDELKAKAAEVLGEIVARGTPDQVAFAAAQLGYVDGTPIEDLLAALRRDDVRDADARMAIGGQIEREILDRGAPYDEWLRTQAGRFADYHGVLGSIFLLRDRPWALAHLDEVLGGNRLDNSMGVRGALSRLDPAGQQALAAELRASAAKLPQPARDGIEHDLAAFGL